MSEKKHQFGVWITIKFKKMNENNQTRCLDYLNKYGSITTLQAIRDLGNTRLAATIHLLRKDGHSIDSETIKVPTRWTNKNGTRVYSNVSKYFLSEVKKETQIKMNLCLNL